MVHGLKQRTGLVPGTILDTIVAVHEATVSSNGSLNKQVAAIFEHLLMSLCYKFRACRPCVFANVRWDVVLPEDMDVQVTITASVVSLERFVRRRRGTSAGTDSGSLYDQGLSGGSICPAVIMMVWTETPALPASRVVVGLYAPSIAAAPVASTAVARWPILTIVLPIRRAATAT